MSLDGMKDRCILLDGFSKTYAMTGWRMGYGVMRADLAAHIARLMTNSNSCTASFTQIAGVEAIQGPQDAVDEMCAKFKERRDVMVKGLNQIKGFSCLSPKAPLCFSQHQRDGLAFKETGRQPAGRFGQPHSPERPSVALAKAISASVSPTQSRTSKKPWNASVAGRRSTCKGTFRLPDTRQSLI